ncbi:DUF3383 family protein [Fictibacillus gelatini]|uniref:DUF3383 family protein n=1 Tax=Fictibacillus gelatini TaxID=225985 RepID=UPI000410A3BB|nr:DUF3383 family protein [Fictibacillus gelatini]
MPLQDVKVTIDLVKPAGLVGLGKPLILAKKTGTSTIKNYSDLDAVKVDFPDTTNTFKKAQAIFAQEHRPQEIAIATYDTAGTTDNSPVKVLDKYYDYDWFFVLTADATVTEQLAVADFVQSQNFKMFVAKVSTAADRNGFKQKAYDRTVVFYHTIDTEHPDAALVGELGSQPVGSITWKFKKLNGITPLNVSASELATIHTDGAIVYVTKSGRPQTSEGQVASREYIDVMHGKDWIKVNMENEIQAVFSNNPKVPYDGRGISLVEGAATTTLKQAFTNGIIAADNDGNPLYTVTAKSRNDVPAGDRASRVYNGLSFSFQLAGAIHSANITGQILI